MAQAVAMLADGDRWVPLPYGEIRFGVIASNRPAAGAGRTGGTLFVWGRDMTTGAGVLTALDLDLVVRDVRRVQVGAGSVELPAGSSLADATYGAAGVEAEVRVVIAAPGGGHCTVSSHYGQGDIQERVEEELRNDGRLTRWYRDPAGRTWQTAATESDVFTVTCDTPSAAETLAKSASFATP
jgi:hypothetical protein